MNTRTILIGAAVVVVTLPVPLINFHGTADLVPYNGGTVWASPRIHELC